MGRVLVKQLKTISRGRKPFVMSDDHRVKIANSNILNRLISCGEGKTKLEQSEITVGLGLLKKVLPDLSAVTLSGDPNNPLMIVSKEQKDAATAAFLRSKS